MTIRYLHAASDPIDPARVGGKGAGLLEAARIGLRVPAFAILTTDLSHDFRAQGALPAELEPALDAAIAEIERATGRRLGDPNAPLLLSVRSGAPVSMPGALDTVLDVGASASVIDGLERELGDRVAALDVRRRFLESWGAVVRRMTRAQIDDTASSRIASRASSFPRAARTPESLAAIVAKREAVVRAAGELPEDPRAQLRAAIEAVLRSWDLDRARAHRSAHGIDDSMGMAIVLQAMVFGNAPGASGSGVAYTRSPVSGEKHLFGEYLPGAQGDEVVGGRSSPAGLSAASSGRRADESLERQCPEAFRELERIAIALEELHGDAQDIELTVERGVLYVLQIRTAKRAPRAALRIAVDLVREGRIDRAAAIARVEPSTLDALVARALPEALADLPLTVGVPASPGAVAGRVVLEPALAVEAAANGESVILVRSECSPEDAPGIRAAAGVLTSSGGLTSHAAVIARALGKPCIVAASELRIDFATGRVEVRQAGGVVRELPSTLTLDGATGRVFAGALALHTEFTVPEARELAEWARELGAPGPWADALARLPR